MTGGCPVAFCPRSASGGTGGCLMLRLHMTDAWFGPRLNKSVAAGDMRLAAQTDAGEDAETGGLEQARHPAHEIEPTSTPVPEIADPLGLGEDDTDQAAECRTMNRVQALGTARTVYGLDAASSRWLSHLRIGGTRLCAGRSGICFPAHGKGRNSATAATEAEGAWSAFRTYQDQSLLGAR